MGSYNGKMVNGAGNIDWTKLGTIYCTESA